MAKEITTQELHKKLKSDEKFYLMDVRDSFNYEHNHLPQAIGLAWGPDFSEELPHVLPDKDAEVVVYGQNEACVMAKNAVEFLENEGYSNIYLYRPGFLGWMESGLGLDFVRRAS
jgi:rhodanese-related sulfurtransferase